MWRLVVIAAIIAAVWWALVRIVAASSISPIRASVAAPACPIQPSWAASACHKLTFSDNFSGNRLDSEWETVRDGAPGARGMSAPFNPGYEVANYSSANVGVRDGHAILSLTHVPSGAEGQTLPWTGAVMDTAHSFSQRGGYFEARIHLQGDGRGRILGWPAWWAVGTGDHWPAGGEIDIFEALNDNWPGEAAAHLHYAGKGDNGPGWNASKPFAGWHTFGAHWSTAAQRVWFYYDGRLVWSHPFPASEREFLIFDYTLAPDAIRPPSGKAVMLIDWVRAWSD